MIFEIVNTILLLCSLAINIKILNIANKMRTPKISLADIATDMMNCDNFDTHEACDNNNNYEVGESINRNDKNNVSHQNIYKDRIDNVNDNIKLLGNNHQDQINLCGEQKEWMEIKINK
jgi:hypothetical protein